MADEGRKRLAFDNIYIQVQGALKLCAAVTGNPGRPLDHNTQQVAELEALWDNCTSSSIIVSAACCQCLVQLVQGGHAQFRYVLTGLLNALPAASNLSGALQAISALLLLQVKTIEGQGRPCICPYALRSPPHPFISVLTSRPDSAQLLVEQISFLLDPHCNSTYELSSVFSMVEPFIKFVMADPRNSADQTLRLQLHTVLLEVASNAMSTEDKSREKLMHKVVDLLVALLPYYQISPQSIGHTTFLVSQLAQWMVHQTAWMHNMLRDQLRNVVYFLLSLCHERLNLGLDAITSIVMLAKMQQNYPEVFKDANLIWSLAVLLMECPSLYSNHILNLWCAVVGDSAWQLSAELSAASTGIMTPILLLLSSPPPIQPWSTSSKQSTAQVTTVALHHAENILQSQRWSKVNLEKESPNSVDSPSPWLRRMLNCTTMAAKLISDEKACLHWLQCLKSAVSSQDTFPNHITMLLSSLVLASSDGVVLEALQVLCTVAKAVPTQSPNILPLLLYKLSKETSPELKLRIMYTIPELATHKLCVGPVLRTVQSFLLSPSLRPVALRLLCKLWQKQPRLFPHLHKALMAAETGVEGNALLMELQIAKAATIRDICQDRPSQHGGDLLGMLSTLVNENARTVSADSDRTAVIVSLALQGIRALCQAEVVDICTVWRVLAPKLGKDKRAVVLKSLCDVFALVPSLTTDTKEYKDFKDEVLLFLWTTSEHQVPWVAGSAFVALSNFKATDFKLIHLPGKISLPIKEKLLCGRKLEQNEDQEEVERSVDASPPPGYAYIALIQGLHPSILADCKTFLASLLREEALSVPRRVIHNASRASKSRGWALSGIPSFLQNQYEKSKTPGLNQGLAAGLLFSFEPPFEEHTGKRARRYLVNCARSYRVMLDSLLHEVPVQPSEWHRNLLLPHAWTMFMSKLYSACVEGRKAELTMQQSRGHITDSTELRDKLHNAWLWVRDQLTEQLKAASRGSPSVQGNSVLALAGLAFAVSSHVSQQSLESKSDPSDEACVGKTDQADQCLRTKEWLLMVADTIMVVLDGNYKAHSPTFAWCQQVSSPTSTASSLLARACAALSLSQIVPVLATLDPRRIKHFTEALKLRIPGQSKAGSSAVMQVHCGLGLGLLLSKLYQEHYSELAGNEGYLLMTTALDALENAGLSMELENTEGSSLGAGIALSSLCKENIVDSRVHLQNTHHKLKELLQNYSKEPDLRLQTLCFSFALVSANAFHVALVSAEDARNCLHVLQGLDTKHNQFPGVSLSLGLLLHELATVGHVTDLVIMQHLMVWRSWIENKDLPTLQQLAGVNGLMALLGSERTFFQVEHTLNPEKFGKGVFSGILKMMQSAVSSPQDIGLATTIAWLLGHVYAASTSTSASRTSVPDSYSYLPDSSTLRAVFDFLATAGKTGSLLGVPDSAVNAVLESLVTGPRVGLPPVNWAAVLGPIMRSSFGSMTNKFCLQFAVVQAKSSCSLPPFLSSWLNAGRFPSLQVECRKELYQSVGTLVSVVPSTRAQEFFQGPVVSEFDPVKDIVMSRAILSGIRSVLQLKDPPPSVFGWASTALHSLCSQFTPDMSGDMEDLLGSCLAELPPDSVDRLTQSPSVTSALLRCSLVASGQAKLRWLNTCINWIMASPTFDASDRDLVLWHLVQTLCANSKHKTDERLQWLMDLTNQIRTAASDTSDQRQNKSQVLSQGLTLLSAVCMCWADSALSLDVMLGQRSHTAGIADQRRRLEMLLLMLPGNLLTLLKREPWAQHAPKMLEWLLILRDSVYNNADLQNLLQDCVLSLRESEAYKRTVIWTEAITR